jgi:periplasmic protein TonB
MNAVAVSSSDRISTTLLFSLLLHAVVVLGITFVAPKPGLLLPTLEVILVEAATTTRPEEADYLAQVSQEGGGESEERLRPTETVAAPIPKIDPGPMPVPQRPSAPPPAPERVEDQIVAREAPRESVRATPQLAAPMLDQISSRELIERSMEMARLAAEIEREAQAYAKRPRRKFISANTREYEYAAYMRAWVSRVERVGNLNYPEEARSRDLHGQLVLTVAVRRDGSVESAEIIQPSGQPVLDQAALRIVQLSAPFQVLPETEERVDVLHITRTWQFLPGGVLRQR